MSDLRKYQRRLKKEQKDTVEGIRAGKREKSIAKRVEETYNFMP
jgi:hypothetical protein